MYRTSEIQAFSVDYLSSSHYNICMSTNTFKGGLHLPEHKELSDGQAIHAVCPSAKLFCIPVTQGGAQNNPVVAVGDKVARGQKIAESDAFMSVPVHSSVSGVVKSIENKLVSGNVQASCIIIEKDDRDDTAFLPVSDPFTCTKEEAVERIKQAGIVGMGGAAFPTHVKLSPPADKPIDCIIANGSECEPYLTVDERTMIESADAVIDGLAIVMHIAGAKSGILALEDNKTHVLPILEEAIEKAGYSQTMGTVLCKTKYPQGSERSIIQAALNREIPRGGLPFDVGCLVCNVGTLCAISEAFREGKPLIERAFTVSGKACTKPQNLKVPVGTLISDLIEEYFDVCDDVKKIISGGPMMGFAMKSPEFPVQKNTSGILFFNAAESNLTEESPCIGCGRCIKGCPWRLTPVLMARALKNNDTDTAKKYGLMDCAECGSCAYVCPAHVRLVHRFRLGKMIARKKEANAKAKAAAMQKGGK
ncbi:MAG: electron transport complex subunit RsxC [Spirochaetales bacterium]